MDFQIRELRPEDVENGLLETLSALSEVNLKLTDAERLINHRICYQWRNVRTWVAVSKESKVVGHITLLWEPKLIHSGKAVGHIEDVVVASFAQSSGVGKALVNHVIQFCRDNGAYKILLNCSEKLSSYYAKLGFKEQGVEMRMDLN